MFVKETKFSSYTNQIWYQIWTKFIVYYYNLVFLIYNYGISNTKLLYDTKYKQNLLFVITFNNVCIKKNEKLK